MASAFVVLPATPAAAAATATVEAGYGGFMRVGRPFPVRVTVSSDRLVRGTIELDVSSNGPGSTSIEMPVEVPGGGAKSYLIIVPALPPMTETATISARLLADGGRKLAEANAATTTEADERELVGVLPGAKRGSEVPAPVPLAVDAGVADFHAVGAQELAAAPASLEPLGTILAGSGDLGALTDKARRGVLTWLNRGGTLVVDAVPGGAIAGLPAEWQPGAAGHHSAGLGRVVAAADAFAANDWSKRIFPTVNSYGLDPRFSPFDGGAVLSRTLAKDAGVRIPQIGWLLAFLVLYTLIVGPLLGVALNRAGRAELAWVLIPLVAVVFTAGSWAAGGGLRTRTHTAHATIVEHSPAGSTLTSFVGVAATNNLDTVIGLEGGSWTGVAGGAQFDDSGPQSIQVGDDGPSARLQLTSGQFAIAGIAGPSAQARPLMLTASSGVDGAATGTVKNETEHTLHDVLVMVGNLGTRIGQLRPGQQTEWSLDDDTDGALNRGHPFATPESRLWRDGFNRFEGRVEESSVANFAAWHTATALAGSSRPRGLAVAVGWTRDAKTTFVRDGGETRAEGRTAFAVSAPVSVGDRITDMAVRGQMLGDGGRFRGGPPRSEIVRFTLPDGRVPSGPLKASVNSRQVELWIEGQWRSLRDGGDPAPEVMIGGGALTVPVPEGRVGGIRAVPAPDVAQVFADPDAELDVPLTAVKNGQVFMRVALQMEIPTQLTLREQAP